MRRVPTAVPLLTSVALLLAVSGAGHASARAATRLDTVTASQIPPRLRSQAHARSWIESYGNATANFAGWVSDVRLALDEVLHRATPANIAQLADIALTASDGADRIKTDFAYQAGNPLGDAEQQVIHGAAELRSTITAVLSYADNPTPAGLARDTRLYRLATATWNHGVETIWRLALHRSPPTV
jgi:hypothetical protein